MKASQEEIDFVFGAIDWKYEGFPANQDGSVEIEVDFDFFVELVWGALHDARRIGLDPSKFYIDGKLEYILVPERFLGTYRISPSGERTFESWYDEQ